MISKLCFSQKYQSLISSNTTMTNFSQNIRTASQPTPTPISITLLSPNSQEKSLSQIIFQAQFPNRFRSQSTTRPRVSKTPFLNARREFRHSMTRRARLRFSQKCHFSVSITISATNSCARSLLRRKSQPPRTDLRKIITEPKISKNVAISDHF